MDLPFINDPSNIFYAGDDPNISSVVHSCMIELGKVIAGSSEKNPKQKLQIQLVLNRDQQYHLFDYLPLSYLSI